MNWRFGYGLIFAVTFVFQLGAPPAASAAPTADLCSLLPSSEIARVLGQPFGAPDKIDAPPAYRSQSSGSNCAYRAQKRAHVLVTFIAYADSSTSEAKQTFEKLAWFYKPVSRPAIGDSAYIDAKQAIHVARAKCAILSRLTPPLDPMRGRNKPKIWLPPSRRGSEGLRRARSFLRATRPARYAWLSDES